MTEPTWVKYQAVAQHATGTGLYPDILNHYKGSLTYSDVGTKAHETTHMIHADLRNAAGYGFSKGGSFYVGKDRSIGFVKPNFRKSAIAKHIPRVLQASRYRTYVTGQTEWDDNPLYLYDEWVAYTDGGQVSVEQAQKGEFRSLIATRPCGPVTVMDGWGNSRQLPCPVPLVTGSWTDAVMGLLEFSVYCTAVVMEVERTDSTYLTRVPEFLQFTGWNLANAWGIYTVGSKMDQFKWDQQDAYLNSLRTDSSCQPVRDALVKYFGGVWLSDKPAPPNSDLDYLLI